MSLSFGTLFIDLEEDLRGRWESDEDLTGEINALGGSLRKVISDSRGDRFIFFAQAELHNNLSEFMLHQAYGQIKGPMGKWNVSVGRVPLPWGLLTDWSPERMPYASPYRGSRLNTADNGILLDGVIGMADYGIALTQGYGMADIEEFPGPGLLTARVGITPFITGDLVVGLSLSHGTVAVSAHGHGMGHVHEEEQTAIGLDNTLYYGRGLVRFEGVVKRYDASWEQHVFANAEYALLPRLTIETAGQAAFLPHDEKGGSIYTGISLPIRTLTFRGGYEYETYHEDTHSMVLQLYRSFSTVR